MSSNTPKTILLLAANPKDTTPLGLGEEVREIDAGLQRARNRDQFVLKPQWAVRPRDIHRAMLDLHPSFVHFSGHGRGDEGLVFEDEAGITKLVDGESLAELFELFADQVECVVLNGCYSEVQATAIARHANYVIGMNKAILDRAAIEFAVAFYDALGAGRPIEFAHKLGCTAIRLASIPEHLTPVLKKKPGISDPIATLLRPEDQLLKDETMSEASNLEKELNPLENRLERAEPSLPHPIEMLLKEKFGQIPLIMRSEEIQQIASKLLNSDRHPNIVVLWGPIGCGKTTLALLACSCCEAGILNHFTGGIFWVNLEKDNDILKETRNIYQELKNSFPCNTEDIRTYSLERLKLEVRKQWRNQPYLIVLDNVQSEEEFTHFYSIINNEHCTLLITIRNKIILTKYNTNDIKVDSLESDEMVLLLEDSFNKNGKIDKKKLEQLVNTTYEWPLLFRLIRNKIAEKICEGYNPNSALDSVIRLINNEKWKSFESEISERLRKSLDFLSEDEQKSFKDMIVFKAEAPIPLSVIKRIWRMNESDTEELCGKLYALSLLKEFDSDQPNIRLISYLSEYLKQTEELKGTLPEIHNKLLESYEKEYQIELGSEVPSQLIDALSRNDEKVYLNQFYKYHRSQANRDKTSSTI